MAVNHPEYRTSPQAAPSQQKSASHAYRALIAASVVSSVTAILYLLVLALGLYSGDGLPIHVSVPEAIRSSPLLFWIVLLSGILGVAFWAAMVRQKSINAVRIATMKFELAEMALRSDQRVKGING